MAAWVLWEMVLGLISNVCIGHTLAAHSVHYLLMLLGRIWAKECHTEKIPSSCCAGLHHQKAGGSDPSWKLVLRSHDLSSQVQACGAALLCGDGFLPCPGHPLHGKFHLPIMEGTHTLARPVSGDYQ